MNVTKESHERAKIVKEETGESWTDVLDFYATYRQEIDELTAQPRPEPGEVDVDINAEELAETLEAAINIGLDYDDVKGACRRAIREELPVEEMRR